MRNNKGRISMDIAEIQKKKKKKKHQKNTMKNYMPTFDILEEEIDRIIETYSLLILNQE